MFEITNCRLAGNLIGRLKRKEQLNLSCMKALLNESLSLMINLDKPLESISHIDSEINSIINIIRTSAISSENKESNIKSKMHCGIKNYMVFDISLERYNGFSK